MEHLLPSTIVELNLVELRRLQHWYEVFAADETECVMRMDQVLDMKLRASREDAVDRVDAEVSARCNRHSAKQHFGPERRTRAIKHRMIRPARAVTPEALTLA